MSDSQAPINVVATSQGKQQAVQTVDKQEQKDEGTSTGQTGDKAAVEQNQEAQIQKMMEEMQIDEAKDEKMEDEPAKVVKSQNEGELLNDTKYFVDISRSNISFGRNVLFPGSIEEIDVNIGLKDEALDDSDESKPFMLRVIAKCSNNEFDALDEYVFSVRSNDRFEYFEEVRFKIRKKQKAQVKVAVKIPPVKENYIIEGILEIQLQSLEPICIPITSKCEVPQIICVKNLYKADEGINMIKIPAKKNQIRMPPIPFKNMSNFNFTLEVEAITNESFANRPYDIVTQNFVNCQANMQFFVNLQLKENMNYKGVMPIKDTIRKILVLKIKNSSVYFNYPIEVNVFESSVAGGSN